MEQSLKVQVLSRAPLTSFMERERTITRPVEVADQLELPTLPIQGLLSPRFLRDKTGLAAARRAAEAEIYGASGEDPRFPPHGRLRGPGRTVIPSGFRPT